MPQVRARLEAKERAVVGRAERDMEMLEKDLEELRRRDKEISQLLQSDDNAHFIQVRWKKRVDMFIYFIFLSGLQSVYRNTFPSYWLPSNKSTGNFVSLELHSFVFSKSLQLTGQKC